MRPLGVDCGVRDIPAGGRRPSAEARAVAETYPFVPPAPCLLPVITGKRYCCYSYQSLLCWRPPLDSHAYSSLTTRASRKNIVLVKPALSDLGGEKEHTVHVPRTVSSAIYIHTCINIQIVYNAYLQLISIDIL